MAWQTILTLERDDATTGWRSTVYTPGKGSDTIELSKEAAALLLIKAATVAIDDVAARLEL